MAAKIKKNDKVQILAGKDAGRQGDVLAVNPKESKLLVRDINMVTKHNRPSRGSEGGIARKEAKIDISNVALLDPKDDKPTRVGFKTLDDGRKVRFAKRSGEVIES